MATFGLSRCLRLEPPEATTVAIECVYQNTALALAISLSAFPRSMAGAATAVPLVYGLAEIVFIFCFGCFAWRMGWSHAPNFCTMPRRQGLLAEVFSTRPRILDPMCQIQTVRL